MALLREPGSSRISADQIRAAGGPRAALSVTAGLFAEQSEQRGGSLIDEWRERGIATLSYDAPGYPRRLAELADPPPLLFLRGALSDEDAGGVAVIGTREPSVAGTRLAGRVATALVQGGYTVVSGLAAGIDTTAHLAALQAGGRTVAVLGHGLDHVYPAANAALARRLHAAVSQFWPEQPPARANFRLRNAVMSGISRATVIIEAGERSGARIQARHALAQGRELFLMAPLLRQEWARSLAHQARVRVIEAADDLVGALDAR